MPFLELPDTRIYFETHGRAEAPPLVFLHGAGGNHLSWWQQIPHFRERYRCVTMSHRGFGQSIETGTPRGGAAFADDLRALLDHLGIERAPLVAQSMGGWTALRFALAHPRRVERIMMCDTHGGIETDEINAAWGAALAALASLPEGVHPAAGERMMREQPELNFLYFEIEALNPTRTPGEMFALLRSTATVRPDDVAALPMPVQFLVGDEDITIPETVIALASKCIPQSRLVRVPKAGHSVYFERAAEFNGIVDKFLGSA